MNGDARLSYTNNFSRWQGEQSLVEGGILLVWMTDDTFRWYVDRLLSEQGLTAPTQDERDAAREQCQNIAHWIGLAKEGMRDPRVSMRVLGGEHPGAYRPATRPTGEVPHARK